VFAYGLRNEVGLSIDSRGRMWGVENGRDNLMVGGDIHNDNPAEEVNLFDVNKPGRNYGYPFCWSEGIWMDTTMAKGPGTQHLDPDQPGAFTEAKCQDKNVVVPPAFVLGAHVAPLDVVEYRGGGYPADMQGDLFVTAHGSWNREISQVGMVIIRLYMGPNGPTGGQNFLGKKVADTGEISQGNWGIRPVSIRVDKAGLLTFSDDTLGTVNKIGYRP
jgi:glucose/arabinose dehydrogenase